MTTAAPAVAGRGGSVPRSTGRTWAHAAFALGLGASIAANIAHAWVGGTPTSAGPIVASIFWPVMVLAAVELLTKVAWPAGWTWLVCRFGGVGLVGLVAAAVSYRHMSGLLASYGEDPLVSALGPIAVDGLMVMATASRLAEHASTDAAISAVPASTEQVDPALTPKTPTTAAGTTAPAEPTPRPRRTSTPTRPPTRPAGRPAARPRPSTKSPASTAPGSTPSDTVLARVDQVMGLIAAGELDPEPSATAILKAVGGKGALAREVRDIVHARSAAPAATTPESTPGQPSEADPEPVLDPAQMSIEDVLGGDDAAQATNPTSTTRPRLVA